MTKVAASVAAQEHYWERRLRSAAFRRALHDVVKRELATLAEARIGDAVDAELVRTAIREWDPGMLDSAAIADVIVATNRRTASRLRRRDASLRGLLDARVIADLEALLTPRADLTPQMEELLASLMQHPFVRALFTDVVFTAIVSFYQRINPLFGGLAMHALEDQIKAFIRYVMPTLLQQATAFATSQANRRILTAATRTLFERLLEQPLGAYVREIPAAQRRRVHGVIRTLIDAPRLHAALRDAALAVFEDVYPVMRDKRVREVVRIDAYADWLAARGVASVLPILARPPIVRFIATEMALGITPAAGAARAARGPRRAAVNSAPRRRSD